MPANPKKAALKQKVMALMNPTSATTPAVTAAPMPEAMSQPVAQSQQPTGGYLYGEQDLRPLAAYKMGKYVDFETGAEVDPMSKEYKFGGRVSGETFDTPPLPVTSGKYSKKK